MDWKHIQQRSNTAASNNTAAVHHHWTKPATGKLECNVDSECYTEQNIYCTGACVRDSMEDSSQLILKEGKDGLISQKQMQ
ncbi:hypothetical protein P8452_61600 [Trifolium repens]|jgi:hypothetical protein|nr:hypothetical protein P8452_61600 [Trifolium repens]